MARLCANGVTIFAEVSHGQREQRSQERDEEAEKGQEVVLFTLETDRLLVRPWTSADREAFTAFTRDPELMRYVHGGVAYTEEEIDEFLSRQARQLAEHDLCMGALVERATNRVVGVAGAQPLGNDIEIGWWLARDVWRRGHATEIGRAAMRHVLETLGRERVIAIIDPGNVRSAAVVNRLGFRCEGRVTGADLGHRKPEIVVDLYVKER
jgi:RimJ/RimL family protein N-acetyltransferase